MPSVLRNKLQGLGLDNSAVETLVEELPAGRFMLKVINNLSSETAKRISNWLATDVQAMVANEAVSWQTVNLDVDNLGQLSDMVAGNKVSSTGAKVVLEEIVLNGGNPQKIAEDKDVLQVSDEGEITKIVELVLKQNPQAAEDIKNGETKAVGFLVGQVMKVSKGQANPGLAQELIKKLLSF